MLFLIFFLLFCICHPYPDFDINDIMTSGKENPVLIIDGISTTMRNHIRRKEKSYAFQSTLLFRLVDSYKFLSIQSFKHLSPLDLDDIEYGQWLYMPNFKQLYQNGNVVGVTGALLIGTHEINAGVRLCKTYFYHILKREIEENELHEAALILCILKTGKSV